MEETSAKVQLFLFVVVGRHFASVHVPLHTCSRKISQNFCAQASFSRQKFPFKLLPPSPDPSACWRTAGGFVVKREEYLRKLHAMNSKGDEKRSASGGGGGPAPSRLARAAWLARRGALAASTKNRVIKCRAASFARVFKKLLPVQPEQAKVRAKRTWECLGGVG